MTNWTTRTREALTWNALLWNALFWSALVLTSLSLACGSTDTGDPHGADTAEGQHAESMEAGANGGRLLRSGAFELELGIFERGVPPEFNAWATHEGAAVDPGDFTLEVKLTRLGGRVDAIEFSPRGDHRVSTSPVSEPHSFEVSIEASHAGRTHAWKFENFEGRTRITPEMAASLGVETAVAKAATLTEMVTVYGRVRANPERVREIRARFDGAVRDVYAHVGQSVRQDEKVLSVESNESLNRYTIVAPISGVITQRDANPGEQTNGRLLMTITDTSMIWVDLSVFPVDREGVVVGSAVSITPALGGTPTSGVVSMIEATADPHDQSVVARVTLEGAGAQLLPGTFVEAEVNVGKHEVSLAVNRIGLQTFRNSRVVYARVGDVYEVRMLELGREAGEWVEVLGGLEPGTEYVTANSHLIKSDIEKSGAAHGH
jgi:cobalt-zinc-cadmium efflux system membrane fusion protein